MTTRRQADIRPRPCFGPQRAQVSDHMRLGSGWTIPRLTASLTRGRALLDDRSVLRPRVTI
jgi:hypothetical protein